VRWSCTATLNGPHERAEAWKEALILSGGLGSTMRFCPLGLSLLENWSDLEGSSHNL